jgi:hypothetical protein
MLADRAQLFPRVKQRLFDHLSATQTFYFDLDQVIDQRIFPQDFGISAIHHPTDLGIGQFASDVRERRQSVDDVAEGTEFYDEYLGHAGGPEPREYFNSLTESIAFPLRER